MKRLGKIELDADDDGTKVVFEVEALPTVVSTEYYAALSGLANLIVSEDKSVKPLIMSAVAAGLQGDLLAKVVDLLTKSVHIINQGDERVSKDLIDAIPLESLLKLVIFTVERHYGKHARMLKKRAEEAATTTA